jgi:hypothetical protein
MPDEIKHGTLRRVNIGIPYKGLNLKEAVSILDVDSALELVNFMPPKDCLSLRKGFSTWAPQPVIGEQDDLFVCQLGSSKCFMLPYVTSGDMVRINMDGSTQSFNVGQTSGNYSACVFGAYMYFADAQGDVVAFDGTGFVTKTFYTKDGQTQTPVEDLDNPVSFANRLFFTKGLMVYYAKPMETQGEVEELDLSFYAKKGGSIIKSFTFSTNYNDNIMSHVCFLTTGAELITFIGTDPSDENKWSLGGIFDVVVPINKKCFCDNFEGDILIFAKGGIKSLQKIITGKTSIELDNLEKGLSSLFSDLTFSDDNINVYFLKYIKSKKLVVLNVPGTLGPIQYVFSKSSGNWTSFSGIDIYSLGELDNIICGVPVQGQQMYKLFDGYTDNGNDISANFSQGFSLLGSENEKFLRQVEVFSNDKFANLQLSYSLDFDDRVNVAESAKQVQKSFLSKDNMVDDYNVNKRIFYVNENPAKKLSFGVTTTSNSGDAKIYEVYVQYYEWIN